MVTANMGIATMPGWLVKSLAVQSLVEVKSWASMVYLKIYTLNITRTVSSLLLLQT